MESRKLVFYLRDAVARFSKVPFDQFLSLESEHWFEDIGTPTENGESDYFQIEVELVDCLVEFGVDVLHVSVVVRDEFQEFSSDMFVYRDGRIRKDDKVYRFDCGIPHVVDDM